MHVELESQYGGRGRNLGVFKWVYGLWGNKRDGCGPKGGCKSSARSHHASNGRWVHYAQRQPSR